MNALADRPTRCAALLATLAAVAPAALAQTVHVVDASQAPGTDFATFAAALAAATDGDTLLVRPGNYGEAVTLDGLALSIVVDGPPASVGLLDLDVRNLAANEHVTVRGLALSPQLFGLLPAMSIDHCDGRVQLEDCTFSSASIGTSGILRITDARAVTISRCTIAPAVGGSFSEASLVVLDSNVALIDSIVSGANGSSTVIGPSPGTHAMRVVDSRVSISGSFLTGGIGGDGLPHFGPCQDGADGGSAFVMVENGAGDVEIIDTVLVGGAGGAVGGAGCSAGAPGLGVETTPNAGTVVQPPGTAPHFTLTSPLRAGELLQFELLGPPNAPVLLLLGLEPGLVRPYDPILTGVGLVGAPTLILPYFPIPTDGGFDETDAPGTFVLPSGLTHLHLYFQHVVTDPVVGLIASTPASLLVLDPAF